MRTSRRKFIGSLAALGVASSLGVSDVLGRDDNSPNSAPEIEGGDANAQSADLLIKGGYILTMDKELGDLPKGDVHIRDGQIVNVGQNIKVPGARELDAAGMIVMPGMVETHWHVWTSVLRGLAGVKPGAKYFDLTGKYGKMFSPADTNISTRLAMTEAVHSGITYVHDWCHNVRSLDHAKASVDGLNQSGIRGRFSVGLPAGADQESQKVDLDILKDLLSRQKLDKSSLIAIGLALPEAGSYPEARRQEFAAARALGVPISLHAGRKAAGKDSISKVREYLGKDVQIIHAVNSTVDELKAVSQANASLSISPFSELRIGYGFPPVPEMLASGINIGLSVDTYPLSGNADMFAVMKVFVNIAHAMSKDEFVIPARRILEIATIEGARSLGIDDKIGSLKPGKCADLIMISTDAPNMIPFVDPVNMVIYSAQPANVDTVIVNGKILKRNGKLTANHDELYKKSQALLERLLAVD